MRTSLEAVLQAMVTGGWANESDGDVDSPYGAFARVSVNSSELGEIVDAFEDVLNVYPLDSLMQLIGNWLVVEDAQGKVSITNYTNAIVLTRDFHHMQNAYALWSESNG